MAYNLTAIAAGTDGVLGFTQGVNTVLMEGWLGTLILIGVSFVFFGSFQWATNDVAKSLLATSFISFSLAMLLRAVNLIDNFILFTVVLLFAILLGTVWARS